MLNHLTEDQIQRLRMRTMPPEQIVELDQHLEECKDCLTKISPPRTPSFVVADLQSYLKRATAEGASHLRTEQIIAYVDNTLTPVERLNFSTHLALCQRCSSEVDDLVDFKKQIEEPSRKEIQALYSQFKPQLQVAAACLLAFVSVGGLITLWISPTNKFEYSSQQPQQSVMAHPGTATSTAIQNSNRSLIDQIREQSESNLRTTASRSDRSSRLGSLATKHIHEKTDDAKKSKVLPSTNLSGAVRSDLVAGDRRSGISIIDEQLVVRSDGSHQGLDKLDSLTRQQVLLALNSGSVSLPETLMDLEQVVTFRGSDGKESRDGHATFSFLSPIEVVIREDRPLFRWIKNPDAKGYIVRVFDENNIKVADSGDLPAVDSWQPVSSLPRSQASRTFSWKLIAIMDDGREIIATRRTGPPRFAILGEEEIRRLQKLEQLYNGSHLILGIGYAGAGLKDLAKREFTKLRERNPGSGLVERLLQSVKNQDASNKSAVQKQ